MIEKMYNLLTDHAQTEGFINTKKALPFIENEIENIKGAVEMTEEYFIHGLSTACMLKEINPPVSQKEMDTLLAASICHVLCELMPDYDIKGALSDALIDESIADFIINMVLADRDENKDMLKKDHLLFIVKLVERSNLIEHLCDMSDEEAKSFISETKRKLLPMCIYGKKNFPEFSVQIGIVMEKMRTLIQVMDVLFARYGTEEEELYEEILSYRDENYRIHEALKALGTT